MIKAYLLYIDLTNPAHMLSPVPSGPPLITSLTTPSSRVISISWRPPAFTNGVLMSYQLSYNVVVNPQVKKTRLLGESGGHIWDTFWEKWHEFGERWDEIGEIWDEIGERLDEIGERWDEIGERLDEIGKRLDEIGKRWDEIGKR